MGAKGAMKKGGMDMKKRMVLAGIAGVVLLLAGAGGLCAETLAADLGDVRVYSLGYGAFRVESDRARQDFPLNFSGSGGWIEVACSSEVRRVTSGLVGDGVEWVVKTYLSQYLSVTAEVAAKAAAQVASWAAAQGIGYLCGDYKK
jgi:hypothetical protein